MENNVYFIFLVSFAVTLSLITMLSACLCCRKKVPKNELLGLEGMVKLKNPDENINNGAECVSLNSKSAATDIESKRASNAPHRSLPDIPVLEPVGDTGSDLYATVGDKIIEKPQVNSSIKKLASVSQHSSLSQTDDLSSPYARVRSPPHAYDKVRPAEHPYAQLKNNASTSSEAPQNGELEEHTDNSLIRSESNQNFLDSSGQLVIPAASAIAGRISASQELPYMTPPIILNSTQQQNFSGDSQDSSKGYTSISVREPLANIIAQTKQQNAITRRRDLVDSHYATVSDDSDEMYAAIDDPNTPADLYTSGSETYAQIEPPMALTVSVEINTTSNLGRLYEEEPSTNSVIPSSVSHRQSSTSVPDETLIPPTVENLRSMHSRQASSSSCTSSVGILGSPKPEKRQANSPLPPTPKNPHYLSNTNLTNSSSVPSGRNSSASVIDTAIGIISKHVSRENLTNEIGKSATLGNNIRLQDKNEEDLLKKHSLSKDLEGMYAKVMKRNKFSNSPSQNASPEPIRRAGHEFGSKPNISTVDVIDSGESTKKVTQKVSSNNSNNSSTDTKPDNNYETIRKDPKDLYDVKDPGYETIPAEKKNQTNDVPKVKYSAPNIPSETIPSGNYLSPFHSIEQYSDTSEPRYESLSHNIPSDNDPGYETVSAGTGSKKPSSDYDPNYEVLRPTDKGKSESDQWDNAKRKVNDGYSSIKNIKKTLTKDVNKEPGYCSIDSNTTGVQHDYASIAEKDKENFLNNNIDGVTNELFKAKSSSTSIPNTSHHNYSTISETQAELHNLVSIKTNNSSAYSSRSDMKTTPSSESNSSELPIPGYSSLNRANNDDSRLNSSNYESLTGSESDPNYESVRYIDDRENPYERLHNDNFLSPSGPSNELSLSLNLSLEDGDRVTMTTEVSSTNSDSLEVSDYFQV